jgi:hypothetical protein
MQIEIAPISLSRVGLVVPSTLGGTMHNLIQISNGKELVVATDTLKNINARKKQLQNSRRGDKVQYVIRETDSVAKYQKKHKFRSH